MRNYLGLLSLALCLLFLLNKDGFRVSAAPTDGFTPINLGPNNFQLHWPYDVPRESRYTPINQFNFFLEKFWLWNTDKPFRPDSPTKPRTEMRIAGNDYTSGVRQFEGQFQVPSGTNGVCIFQVFGATGSATTLQLRVYDGNLWIYRNQIVESNIFGRLIKLNVIHDVGNSRVSIFINDQQRAVVGGRGPGTFYFKYGVYAQEGSSNYMESGWRGVRIFRR